MFHLRIVSDIGFEVWQDIPDYEGLYQASTYGRIKSVERICVRGRGGAQTLPEKLLKFSIRRGYCAVHLCKNGMVKTFAVHKIIALTFLPNYFNLPCINHKSEVKTSNQVWNLEWCTTYYNNNYGSRNIRSKETQQKNPKLGKIVKQFSLEGKLVATYQSTGQAARENGFSKGNIINACLGKYKQRYGFIWRYA